MAGAACFLISAEQEDAVVGTRAQHDAGQQAGGEDGDADDAVLAEQGHDRAGGHQRDRHHEQGHGGGEQ